MWWRTVTHGRGSEGETGEWSRWLVLFTLPWNMVNTALLPLMRTPRLPVVDWTDAPAYLNGLVRFTERWNLVSACVPSHFVRILTRLLCSLVWAGLWRRPDTLHYSRFVLAVRCRVVVGWLDKSFSLKGCFCYRCVSIWLLDFVIPGHLKCHV